MALGRPGRNKENQPGNIEKKSKPNKNNCQGNDLYLDVGPIADRQEAALAEIKAIGSLPKLARVQLRGVEGGWQDVEDDERVAPLLL